MKSGNINTRNTEKDITVDLNVHFFLPCLPDHTFHNPIAQISLLEEDDNLVVNE